MKVYVCCIYDAKSKVFYTPQCFVSLGVAEREFSKSVRNVDSDFNKFSEDFSIFHTAYYDDETGMFENLQAVVQIATALQLKSVNVS